MIGHFVLSGNSRLTVEVARRLARLGETVVVLDIAGDGSITRRLRPSQPLPGGDGSRQDPSREPVTVITAGDDLRQSLVEADLRGARCLLALADDEEENLLVALAGGEVAADVPVVLQTFDDALADALEQVERDVEVRRAYSVAGLSAPFFVALALGDENLRTMRFGDLALPILRTVVTEDSPLVGSDAAKIRDRYDCEVIARASSGGPWEVIAEDSGAICASDSLLVGGPQVSVFALACENSPRFRRATRRRSLRRRLALRRPARRRGRLRRRRLRAARFLSPAVPAALAVVLLASVAVIARNHALDAVQGFYLVVKTLLSQTAPDAHTDVDTAITAVGLFVGWVLGGLMIAFFAAVFMIERLEESMAVRAERYADHAIIGGLGTVGYRVWELLHKLGVRCIVVDPLPGREFLEAVGQHDPVLAGGINLTETLMRANVDRAVCLIATSEDNIANVEGCMHAKRLNSEIRTVARVFDDPLAERAGEAFGLDGAFAAVEVAAAAFVDAARDPLALRPFKLDGRDFRGLRQLMVGTLSPEKIRAQGLRILAFRRAHELKVQYPSALRTPLREGDTVVVVGLAETVEAFIEEHTVDPRTTEA